MSHRTDCLRRLCLSHHRTSKMIARRGSTYEGVAAILNDAGAMESYLRKAANLTREDIDSLIAPNLTDARETRATEDEILTVELTKVYG